jgi:hypothetical protein
VAEIASAVPVGPRAELAVAVFSQAADAAAGHERAGMRVAGGDRFHAREKVLAGGAWTETLVPVPSWPTWLSPQQRAPPLVVIAQV